MGLAPIPKLTTEGIESPSGTDLCDLCASMARGFRISTSLAKEESLVLGLGILDWETGLLEASAPGDANH